ncbi:uncharacterized protein KRP23_291 [Phytophthora ramorum]|uniref:uncharacterized protein n=1 Tax=Phytophthora ramorum TaxID=164328 RepID=UPI0030B3AC4E|nr:hypothetical protein KRP23_291 [Phytophthora ramorum]
MEIEHIALTLSAPAAPPLCPCLRRDAAGARSGTVRAIGLCLSYFLEICWLQSLPSAQRSHFLHHSGDSFRGTDPCLRSWEPTHASLTTQVLPHSAIVSQDHKRK